MATESTSEENGRRILAIYRHFNSKVGHALASNNFLAVGLNNHWDSRELWNGIKYSVESGWIEREPTGRFKLTSKGFEEL